MFHDEIYSNLRNICFDLLALNFKENDRKEQFTYLSRGLKNYIDNKYKENKLEKNFNLINANLEKIILISENLFSKHIIIQEKLSKIKKIQNKTNILLKNTKNTLDYMKKIEEEKQQNQNKSNLN